MNYSTLFIVIGLFAQYASSSKSHPVTTFLNAKWYRTPAALEIAEYLFDENPTLYWDYVEQLNGLDTPLYKIGKQLNCYTTIDFFFASVFCTTTRNVPRHITSLIITNALFRW